MSRVIKCPICSRTAEMTYRENRVYRSECFNINCKEVVTVTAPSRVAAEELFSKFEKGTIQPKLSIPKKISELINTGDPLYLAWLYANELLVVNDDVALKKREDEIVRRKALVSSYIAGKVLGVELVEVEG